ncbi:ribosomal protein S5 domain 2-like protein [Guyanagaster necrorhizus]|uniref:Ribosomal protein S5 domain 2-like protein n=1 Tax=Guyanagaster necrorhizus TaxID=856835 RepID=A0A9P7VZK6_9AGAR|nr:ribosomal protein S5 domain 2-like protein [Guyanagaster necrorhizus MCA 3950]KAG7449665.1 ribosomal protein S5 domain 2-like protein [Guyanagaster necrorhizus MCA 3950]
MNLDAFVKHSKPQPQPVVTSQEIRDRSSTFVANIFKCTTEEEARLCINHLRRVTHGAKPASHEISAWRCMVLKKEHTGLMGPDDFEVRSGSEDDGEKWAGGKVLNAMVSEAVMDAVVVVSRWYGGTLLGPVRFAHIETCAVEACRAFKQKEELDECVSTLSSLDDTLAQLRSELDSHSPGAAASKVKAPVYPVWTMSDLAKAKRLVKARENAIKSVTTLIEQRR